MDVGNGDRVLVNLAPFIGASEPSDESIPCEVLATDGLYVQVRPVFPYRELAVWVQSCWVEGMLTEQDELIALHD